MKWNQLFDVLKKRPGEYLFWLFANLGGIIITYLSFFTVWTFHDSFKIASLPNFDIYLITGTISLAISGSSYLRLHVRETDITLSPLLTTTWPILLMFTYGVFICNIVKPSTRPKELIWIICIVLFICLMLWASIIWLHEQGLKMDKEAIPSIHQRLDDLQKATIDLPKVEE